MGDLAVTVRMNGFVVEDRVLPIRRLVRIGEVDGADVTFPGADVVVVRMGDRLALRGRHLEEGEQMEIALGSIQVSVEHTMRARLPSEWAGLVDWRFAAAAVLVTVAGGWVDAAEAWADRLPDSPSGIASLVQRTLNAVEPAEPDGQLSAASTAPDSPGVVDEVVAVLAEGPRHLPDDHTSGIGWYPWYRQAVPTDDQVDRAYERFGRDASDLTARRQLARAAYDRDDHEEAAWHYTRLLEQEPSDRQARLRLAWAEKRLGHHSPEIDHYRRLLEVDEGELAARAGLAVALSRLGRLDEAALELDHLRAHAPMSPHTHRAAIMFHALQGQDREALAALERCMRGRHQLSDEMELELRRDLALEPALSRLRTDKRALSLLHRHLAAAAPRPIR